MLDQLEKEIVQYLTPEGKLTSVGELAWGEIPTDLKKQFFQWMTQIRIFDRKMILLQRQGRIGTYAPLEGQEAAQVGSALALSQDDWVFPSYREHGVALIMGMPMQQVILYWAGRVEGCRPPKGVRLMPPAVPIATQIPHAVGAAWAAKLRRESYVSVAYFGDGATSEGDFHEGCNFAGVFRLPAILFCQNNGYAISVPFSRQSASATVAEKASAYGFPGVCIDGNDVLAVFVTMSEAIQKARSGQGPTLIEAVTYRKGAHTTADDASRYRPSDEVEEWIYRRDPLVRYSLLLQQDGCLTKAEMEEWEEECMQKVEKAVKIAESFPKADATHLFAHVFDSLPPSLEQQKEALQHLEGGYPWEK
ncbi:pyruvate dehydrogenase (acetyl-transferring) E1 component subunit alpha [Thermoflavimicrobium daqui]|jgi:pyruvate dehydrogenase E1 component alpha subunit|uniref:Pyruvate dehydrogenase E1 component subunit alpha n=1 Tax=Thermoflavimicrobium daqui TaxID=2137476 RepID=A0A364K180_9BACL|nr:pyruvate dehydrogenase (acetyl-transferring) E1 component subunit alpha [Thermoflavimicrobium daqui]RAL21333.1 pyruvate dehydrogenase (acetyl-transferring) E1 component subunit alpha [Thermoflavimicrobium daqui]